MLFELFVADTNSLMNLDRGNMTKLAQHEKRTKTLYTMRLNDFQGYVGKSS